MKANKNLWVVAATWFCWTVAFGLARVCPITSDDKHTLVFPNVSFTTAGATADTYSQFVQALRKELISGAESYLIPLLREESKVSNAQRFVLVKLSNAKVSTTLAIDVVNVYLVAYQVEASSYFFKDTSADAFADLFKGTKEKIRFNFNGGYPDLEKLGARRENVDLGLFSLDSAIFSLNKYSSSDHNKIAGPLLVVIQMVSEASRISHIERKIMTNFDQRFRPLGDVISLENQWSALSSAIQKSNGGVFQRPVQLQKPNYTFFDVTDVTQIRPSLALLLFDSKKSVSSLGQDIDVA